MGTCDEAAPVTYGGNLLLLVQGETSISCLASPDGMDLWSAVEPGSLTEWLGYRASLFVFATASLPEAQDSHYIYIECVLVEVS